MHEPTVSVIIPCYNTSRYIAETLTSVFAQSRDDFEVIVVNDGSPDTPALEEALTPYRGRITYLKQDNRGISGARNSGIAAARGKYLAFLDSDDLWEPDYLSFQLAALERDPSIDVLYPDAIIFGDSPDRGRRAMELNPSVGEVTFESIVTQQCNVATFATARRDVVVKAGMYDESLRRSEDFDLWIRIAKLGGRIAYHSRPLVRYRKHRASLSADPLVMIQSILRVLAKSVDTLPLTPAERNAVLRERSKWQATLRLTQGKKSFFDRNFAGAVEDLQEANRYFQRKKLAMVIALLRIVPRSLWLAYRVRDRLFFRASTRF